MKKLSWLGKKKDFKMFAVWMSVRPRDKILYSSTVVATLSSVSASR